MFRPSSPFLANPGSPPDVRWLLENLSWPSSLKPVKLLCEDVHRMWWALWLSSSVCTSRVSSPDARPRPGRFLVGMSCLLITLWIGAFHGGTGNWCALAGRTAWTEKKALRDKLFRRSGPGIQVASVDWPLARSPKITSGHLDHASGPGIWLVHIELQCQQYAVFRKMTSHAVSPERRLCVLLLPSRNTKRMRAHTPFRGHFTVLGKMTSHL